MMQRSLALLFSVILLAGCDVFPTKASKNAETEQKWWDEFYGKKEESSNDYCSFYGTCKSGKKEESSWDWWTGGDN